jgi:signal peptide peptidase SppA
MFEGLTKRLKSWLPDKWRSDVTVIPVVRASGPIGTVMPFSSGTSLAALAEPLERAFSVAKAPAVAIVVNSPGGSPVQSRLIYERIRALADENAKQVLVFIEDAAASGGYMIACAGDEIIADPSSIVGSIGVVSSGFGFTDMIAKFGIERRVYTSGERKVTLDAFRPEVPEDVAHLKALQAEVHETFIEIVRERRGSKLMPDADLFSGLFWTGKRGVELGLIDGLGDLRGTLRARFGEDVKLKLVGQAKRGIVIGRAPRQDVAGGLTHFSGSVSLPESILGTLEARGLWSRLGL